MQQCIVSTHITVLKTAQISFSSLATAYVI